MPNNHPTLFERIGGKQMIAEVVDDFYPRVFADPELKPFFKNTSIDKQRSMQQEFFGAALDGPITYTGKPLSHVHHGRGILFSLTISLIHFEIAELTTKTLLI